MDFADEHYVKLYTRETPTSLMWEWQAVAFWPNLLKKINKAGVLDIGIGKDAMRRLSVTVRLPVDVCEVALRQLIEDGSAEVVDGRIVVPKFLEAQEARKTDAAKARHYRERLRDKARAKSSGTLAGTVTDRYTPSPAVTRGDPPSPTPARPLPDPDPELLAGERPPAKTPKPPKVETPPDPRHAPLVAKLVEVYKRKRSTDGYPGFNGKHAKLVTRLLAAKPSAHSPDLWPITLAAAWERSLDARFPECSTLEDFEKQLARHVGTGPPNGSAERAQDVHAKRAAAHQHEIGDLA